jgi:hypothetical protein
MVMTMKITVMWYKTPCSLVNRHRRFGGTSSQRYPSQKVKSPEGGNSWLLRNVDTYLSDYTASNQKMVMLAFKIVLFCLCINLVN